MQILPLKIFLKEIVTHANITLKKKEKCSRLGLEPLLVL